MFFKPDNPSAARAHTRTSMLEEPRLCISRRFIGRGSLCGAQNSIGPVPNSSSFITSCICSVRSTRTNPEPALRTTPTGASTIILESPATSTNSSGNSAGIVITRSSVFSVWNPGRSTYTLSSLSSTTCRTIACSGPSRALHVSHALVHGECLATADETWHRSRWAPNPGGAHHGGVRIPAGPPGHARPAGSRTPCRPQRSWSCARRTRCCSRRGLPPAGRFCGPDGGARPSDGPRPATSARVPTSIVSRAPVRAQQQRFHRFCRNPATLTSSRALHRDIGIEMPPGWL